MKEILTNYIVPSGVVLTFIASLITIYITRINSRSSKYIDTITSERIKWIEKIRLEVADLNSCLLTIIKNQGFVLQVVAINERKGGLFKDIDIFHQTGDFKKEIQSFSKTDLFNKINIIRLRLNPKEDEKIIICLNELMVFILSEKLDEKSVQKAWETNLNLLTLTQMMLKQEWEKVKKEAHR